MMPLPVLVIVIANLVAVGATAAMTDLRIIPCEACGGDGYFAEPVSHDPFSGRIKGATHRQE